LNEALAFWKTAHVLSAALLFGTGLGIAYYGWFGSRRALRTGDIAGMRLVLRLTVLADAWITVPAVVFQAASGLVLMNLHGWPLTSPWSIAAWQLFALTGAFWLPAVIIQIRLCREAERAPSTAMLRPQFHRWFRLWFALGVPAFTTLVVLYYLMIAKPLAITPA